MERRNSALIFWILALLFLFLVLREPLSQNFGGVERYEYSEFIEKVQNKEVLKCSIGKGEIRGELKNGTRFTTNFIPEIAGAELEKILRENGVRFNYKTPLLSEGWQNFIFFLLFPILFLIIFWSFFLRGVQAGNRE
ncbi:MAG: ATP-dependent metallopeptidase FtsH/Yme1/Tma family protein, partial [bacterium]